MSTVLTASTISVKAEAILEKVPRCRISCIHVRNRLPASSTSSTLQMTCEGPFSRIGSRISVDKSSLSHQNQRNTGRRINPPGLLGRPPAAGQEIGVIHSFIFLLVLSTSQNLIGSSDLVVWPIFICFLAGREGNDAPGCQPCTVHKLDQAV